MTDQPYPSEDIGRHFEDTPAGTVRRYWFVGGLGAGVFSTGAILHWGIEAPPLLFVLLGGVILFTLLTSKQRGNWDV